MRLLYLLTGIFNVFKEWKAISDCMLLQRLSSFISHRNSSEIFSIVSLFLWSMVYSRYWIFELLDGVVD